MIVKNPEIANVGDTLPAVSFGPISRTILALYAGASGDHNPIHIDIDFAKRAGMKDVFAHGMLSMAQVGRVVTSWAQACQIVSIGVRFKSITQVGDTLECFGEVVEKFIEDKDVLLRISLVAKTQKEVTTVVGEAIVRLAKK